MAPQTFTIRWQRNKPYRLAEFPNRSLCNASDAAAPIGMRLTDPVIGLEEAGALPPSDESTRGDAIVAPICTFGTTGALATVSAFLDTRVVWTVLNRSDRTLGAM